MQCDTCKLLIVQVDNRGYLLYYFGAGPNDPEHALKSFCGPHCATEFAATANVQGMWESWLKRAK